MFFFFFSSRRRHTRWTGDWSSDVCSSDLPDSIDGKDYNTRKILGPIQNDDEETLLSMNRLWNLRESRTLCVSAFFSRGHHELPMETGIQSATPDLSRWIGSHYRYCTAGLSLIGPDNCYGRIGR